MGFIRFGVSGVPQCALFHLCGLCERGAVNETGVGRRGRSCATISPAGIVRRYRFTTCMRTPASVHYTVHVIAAMMYSQPHRVVHPHARFQRHAILASCTNEWGHTKYSFTSVWRLSERLCSACAVSNSRFATCK
ncbi:unnamed protein product [Chondrus crispus]|uniref:Uncharacterized protein n=1 Tax=Chondrus crispus TaxID=2769 RepID=R7Q4U0_CHOCR|nr:unnamed protein product [Chondrus crispus]CDF33014.1 unnamed protein product [Chondrus crispus]|eukprot:XP_005712817.1 unnamed protein product [Chondrus crispus]